MPRIMLTTASRLVSIAKFTVEPFVTRRSAFFPRQIYTMPPRKRVPEDAPAEPAVKRRSTRQANIKAVEKYLSKTEPARPLDEDKPKPNSRRKTTAKAAPKPKTQQSREEDSSRSRAASEDPDVDSIPAVNPEAPRHDGEWYWLLKAEPETRYENGIDVRFSIDDLRSRTKPEGWDGIRNYAARNNMRNMNVGDKAFFYHSNCKEPGIVGVMEIVKEFSEDKSARRPGTPYYDPQSTRDSPRWSLVHVEFRKKFAVPISLRELRELGQAGGPLGSMQLLKQSRLSVTRVSAEEWAALCEIADDKARDAGVEHVTTRD